jgi:hypothetical protein
MFNRLLPPVALSLLLTIGLPAAKDVGPPRGGQATATMFDEITDARERTAFREVWDASEPRRQRDLAIGLASRLAMRSLRHPWCVTVIMKGSTS